MEKKLYTLEELATYLGLSKHTLYKWVESDKIPVLRLGNKLIRFDLDQVNDWLKNKRV
jgi:excisionase family DNA binding protein